MDYLLMASSVSTSKAEAAPHAAHTRPLKGKRSERHFGRGNGLWLNRAMDSSLYGPTKSTTTLRAGKMVMPPMPRS